MKVEYLPNGFAKAILEWNDRPDRDQAWFDRESRSNPEFAREYGRLWGSVVGTPVFAPLYKRALHERKMEPLNATVLRGWDFGFVHPACVWAQLDATGQLGVRRELLGEDETIQQFGERVVAHTAEWFPDAKVFEDFGDPAGHQRNDRAERSSIQILKDLFGIRVKTRPSDIKQGIDRIRLALMPRAEDGTNPGLLVDPEGCPLLAYGFARSYIRDEHDPEKPFKDGYYDHLFDALRYLAINVMRTPKRHREAPRQPTPDERLHAEVRRGLGRRKGGNPVIGDW